MYVIEKKCDYKLKEQEFFLSRIYYTLLYRLELC